MTSRPWLSAPAAATAQRVAVPGKAATAEAIRQIATEASEAHVKRTPLDREPQELLDRHPNGTLIRSLPGIERPSWQSPPPLLTTGALSFHQHADLCPGIALVLK